MLALLQGRSGTAGLLLQTEHRCGIVASAAIDQLVVAGDDSGAAAVWAELGQLGESEVSDCIARIAESRGDHLTVSRRARDDALAVEYSVAGQPDKLFARWLGHVLAFAVPPDDAAVLDRMTGGPGALAADARLVAGLAAVDPAALAWLMILGPEPMDGGTADLVLIQLVAAGDRYRLDWRTDMTSSAEAQAAAAARQQQLCDDAAAPPALAEVARTVLITASGNQVNLQATLTADQLLALVRQTW